jgi:copper chaperone CopZ
MAHATHEHVTLRAPGISCGHCISTIQESLRNVEGVSNVHASVETKLVDMDIDPAKASTDRVMKVLADAGYPATA